MTHLFIKTVTKANEKKTGMGNQPDYKAKEDTYTSPYSKPSFGGIESASQSKNFYNYPTPDQSMKSLLDNNSDHLNSTNYEYSERLMSKSGKNLFAQEDRELNYNLNARRNSNFLYPGCSIITSSFRCI